jgi:hypothetical protein
MGRMYAAAFESAVVAAACDLFEVRAPSNAVVVIHSIVIGQSSDAGDAQAEMLPITVKRATASGSGGSTATPAKLQTGLAAAGSTVEYVNTTRANAGSPSGTPMIADTFNAQGGWQKVFTPEERPVLSPGEGIVVGLEAAPADALTMSGTIVFEEIGG